MAKRLTQREIFRAEQQHIENVYTMRREIISKLLDDSRDIDIECGYPSTISITDYQAMFERNGIGQRVVKLWPEECWNVLPEINEDNKSDLTTFEQEWEDLNKRFKFYNRLALLDMLSGIGRFGAMLFGINDNKPLNEPVDGFNLKTGVVKSPGKYQLMYLKPLSESVITVKEYESDNRSPRFGLPTKYALQSTNIDGQSTLTEESIHWTRVLHIIDNKTTSEIFGEPRLKPVYNYVLDLKKIVGSSAEMFWKGGFPGYAFEVDKERTKALTTDEKTTLREEFTNYSNKLQRYMALVGVTAKSLEPQVADPSNHFLTQIKVIALTLGVPYRKLLGTEESKQAGADDNKTWNRRVAKRQKDYLTPNIVRPFVDRLIQYGVLSEPKDYDIKWPSLEELDPKDAAIVFKDRTDAYSKYISSGIDQLMPPEIYLTKEAKYSEDEARDIIAEAESWADDHIDENEIARSEAAEAALIQKEKDDEEVIAKIKAD